MKSKEATKMKSTRLKNKIGQNEDLLEQTEGTDNPGKKVIKKEPKVPTRSSKKRKAKEETKPTLDDIQAEDDKDFEVPTKKKRATKSKSSTKPKPKKKSDIDRKEQVRQSMVESPYFNVDNPVHTEDGSDSESDWEEVEELPGLQLNEPSKSQIPDKPVEITLQVENIMKKKRKKRGFDMEDWFRQQVNRFKKNSQLEIHKVHLLCLLSTGMRYNKMCSDQTLQALGLSVFPSALMGTRQVKFWNVATLIKLVRWFRAHFSINPELKEDGNNMHSNLMSRFSSKETAPDLEYVMVFIIICRAIGLETRLMYSLQPMSFKAADLVLKPGSQNPKAGDIVCIDCDDESPETKTSSSTAVPRGTQNTCKQNPAKGKTRMKKTKSNVIDIDAVSKQNLSDARARPKNHKLRKSASKVSYTSKTSESEVSDTETPDKSQGQSTQKGGNKKPARRQRADKTDDVICVESSDEDFEPETTSFRSPPNKSQRSNKKRSELYDGQTVTGSDYWAEVYISEESQSICVDCIKSRINHPEDMESRVTKPMSYVLGYDGNNQVKDLTRRYSSCYMSHTRKLRVDDEWWTETLQPYGPKTAAEMEQDKMEDMQMQANLMKKPLPTSINDFKGHPLYVLKRHLLKFEALYPESSIPVGFIRGEAVYARECVHTLHSRENWLKEARLVRIGEEPYKAVKSRKRRSSSDSNIQESTCGLFGRWQTEDYIPPPAVDGKVPRNEYGNVELFQPSMLPGGTVQLKLPGLNRVAKKLGLDCAAAMVGWDNHGRFAHPLMDGWVVCIEDEEILRSAWEEDQEIQRQREYEKKEKRVVGNWKILIKGLLIREKMKKRFQLQSPEKSTLNDSDSDQEKSTTEKVKATDIEMSWPRNRQQEAIPSSSKKSEKRELFPFEVEEL